MQSRTWGEPGNEASLSEQHCYLDMKEYVYTHAVSDEHGSCADNSLVPRLHPPLEERGNEASANNSLVPRLHPPLEERGNEARQLKCWVLPLDKVP